MSGVSSAGQNQHIQRYEDSQRALTNEGLQKQVGAGVIGSSNTFSYYQPSVQPAAGDTRILPLPQPQPGAIDTLGTMNINDILSQLSGLRVESEERTAEAQKQATLANKEKRQTERDKRIKQLQDQLHPPKQDKKNKCANVAMAFASVLMGPVGMVLYMKGDLDKKSISATNNAHNQLLQQHYGAGYNDIQGFEKEYAKDSAKDSLLGQPIDQKKHQARLNELKDKGVIDPELHADLSQLVADGVPPEEVHDRILLDAIEAYVDGEIPPFPAIESLDKNNENRPEDSINNSIKSGESDRAEAKDHADDINTDDPDIFLAKLARLMEEQDKAMKKVQEDLESANTNILNAAQNQHSVLTQSKPMV